ncbi:MAG: hypothetical protein JNK87_42595, partial [Bryobacterales bacterium]|nr:hypothetical protein [Bryobacterales bacterium]
ERAARLIWGPMLAKGETVTLLLATTPQLWVREFGDSPHPVGDPPQVFPMPTDPALLDWYRRTTLGKGEGLILHPNNHSPLGGEAHAAIRLAAFVAERQAHVELLAGEHTGATEIRERNAVVLGRAEYSRAAAALQPNDGWALRYVPERREVGIVSQKGDRPSFFREGGGVVNYGLITVLTKPTDNGPKRTILFAGINSDGSEAAMSYMTSLLQLQELSEELRKGRAGLPDSYQVVVRSRSSNTRSLRAERAAVRVLETH